MLAGLVQHLRKRELQPVHDCASHELQENLCSLHNEMKTVFFRTDQLCICYQCSEDQHKDHDTVSSASERDLRQAELPTKRNQLFQRLQDKVTDLKNLQQHNQEIIRASQRSVKRTRDMLTLIILVLESRRSEIEQQIRYHEELQLTRIQELQDQLQQDVTELKRSISELDTLSHTSDHSQFLELYTSLCADTQSSEKTWSLTECHSYFSEVSAAVTELKDKLQDTMEDGRTSIVQALSEIQVIRSLPEPSSRKDFLQCFKDITMDPNTAHLKLCLSDRNRRVTALSEEQIQQDHPERFSHHHQVLSREGLWGRCYFEVDLCCSVTRIAMSYRDIQRKEEVNECLFGKNNKSWVLTCNPNHAEYNRVHPYSFSHNNQMFDIPGAVSNRIGVFLDHTAGLMSFYSVSENTMNLLHKVQTIFTQPVHVGLSFSWCHPGDTVYLPRLK